jgi:hypothetical protein
VLSQLNQPIPGYWYINRTGKLMKVRMVGYAGENMYSVLIEYPEGTRRSISIRDWQCLDLIIPRRGPDEVVAEKETC